MRNPNGYGCIKHLSGRRRRPFVFVVTDAGRQRPVEYFTNLVDAQIFQADYHRTHHHRSLPGHQITLIELYHRWLPAHIADTWPSQSSLDSYKNAFRYLADLHYEPVTKLRYMDYQRILDDMKRHGLSYSSLKKVRSLISLLEKYALKIVPAKEIPRMFMAMGILTSYESTAVSEFCLSYIHCLRAQYQPVVICAIFAYCLWDTGV